jgi:alkylation response protein AidB-like acyl-CoA dehydrogenase
VNFLKQERTTLKEFFPDLDEKLAHIPLLSIEKPQNPAIQIFRELGGPRLLIPNKYEGLGATPVEAVRVQRAIATRAPSLAIATTMHHFSVATIMETMSAEGLETGLGCMLLEEIAKQNLYVASGFAEGKTGSSILTPYMQVKVTEEGGITVSGSKKPCSLATSMDLLTASVSIPNKSGDGSELAVIIIPASTPGIEIRPFWTNSVLAGAQSDEVILHDVKVPEELISYSGNSENLDYVQIRSFLWFELLISASYLGIASALVERTIAVSKNITPCERVLLGIEAEGAMAALEGVARSMMLSDNNQANDLLARVLFVRYAVQGAIERVTTRAVELLGGMAFISSPEIAYMFAASRALAFHPPSRLSISPALDKYLAGEPLLM